MPPEQATGKLNAVGTTSDVYSLGAVFYCLLTGHPPFQAASHIEILRQVVEQEPASLCLLNRSIPRDLETICLKCLRKEALQRYASAQAFHDDLQCWLESRPIKARPVSRLASTLLWCRRNKLAAVWAGVSLGTVATLFITILLALFFVNQQRFQALTANTLAEANERSAREQSELAMATLTTVIGDFQDGLRNVSGSSEVRRQLLATSIAQLEDVSRKYIERAVVDRQTMIALTEMGSIVLEFGVDDVAAMDASSGNPGAASAVELAELLFLGALDIAEALRAKSPTNVRAQRDLSVANEKLGDVQLQLARTDKARGYYERARGIDEQLSADAPGNASDRG